MGLPHPLLHMGHPPLCSNDTRSGERSAMVLLPFFPRVIRKILTPLPLSRKGSFVFRGPWEVSAFGPVAEKKKEDFL